MPRAASVAAGGLVYHVLNRLVGRMHLFRHPADFEAFERVMGEAHEREPIKDDSKVARCKAITVS